MNKQLNNTVIKVLTEEHGKIVIEWWKSRGVDTEGYDGSKSEASGHRCIYYGIIKNRFGYYSLNTIKTEDVHIDIIELPEDNQKQFDLSTNKGRLDYAIEKFPIGTVFYNHNKKYRKVIGVPRFNSYSNHRNTTIEVQCVNSTNEIVYPDIFTHDQGWVEIIKKIENMENTTQKISREGLKEIHSVACSNWKAVLESYGSRNPLENYIELTQQEVDQMFSACTKEQLPIVSKYLKQDDSSVDVSQFTSQNDSFLFHYNNPEQVLGIRRDGDYKNKAYHLTNKFNWEIKTDGLGNLCLIPTKKK